MKRKKIVQFTALFMAIIALTACSGKQTKEINLSGGWHFRQAGGETWLKATVPGTVHDDLLFHQIIPDPFIGTNEDLVQWVEKEDWEYRTIFKVPRALLYHDAIVLDFKGLDTYADVFLNGKKILEADNMFRAWEVDVKNEIKSGENELLIYFHSPVKRGLEKLQQLDYLLPAENEQAPEGERTNIFSRKAPFHYGWDWGPRLVTSGIWRPVTLKAWSNARITDPYLATDSINDHFAFVKMNVVLDILQTGDYLLITRLDQEEISRLPLAELGPGKFPVNQTLPVPDPKLWWSNGLGEPYLYKTEFVLEKNGETIDTYSLDFGIRTLKLVQEPDDVGHTFHFELNGVPVFMKGANVIPSETLTPRLTRERHEQLIADAVDAHMNMLRVWGGAIYKDDIFYELCDQNGILVWQDFMFACALQPGDEAHLENIRKEAEYNVKRLRNHASIALWCGNNENLHGWHAWGWQDLYTPEQRAFVWRTYERIFHEILPEAVAQFDPKTTYHSSSPSSVGNTLADRRSGDEHDWTVYFGQAPFSNYEKNVPRFVSEYGLQSFANMETIRYFASDDSLWVNAPILDHRQRSRMEWHSPGFNGNLMTEWYAQQYFPETKTFEELAFVSQLVQAKAYKTALEAHRRNMPHCMGSLYWQLNDCWPTTSWSTVDYFGNWKASHYAVRKANQAVIVSPALEDGMVKIYVVSDLLQEVPAKLKFTLIDHNGNILKEAETEIMVKPNQSKVAFAESLETLQLADNNDWFLHVSIIGEDINHENILYPMLPREHDLQPFSIEYKIRKVDEGIEIELFSTGLIKGVYLEAENMGARFSDNYFDLLPGIPKIISVSGKKEPGRITYTSLNNIRFGDSPLKL
ncbi:MAG: glycoside hydrolase family 2 protein [Bacteroidales bacterium]|nr:glycoside hydrolase family 2 protein [Bacteroidales bacterium]